MKKNKSDWETSRYFIIIIISDKNCDNEFLLLFFVWRWRNMQNKQQKNENAKTHQEEVALFKWKQKRKKN